MSSGLPYESCDTKGIVDSLAGEVVKESRVKHSCGRLSKGICFSECAKIRSTDFTVCFSKYSCDWAWRCWKCGGMIDKKYTALCSDCKNGIEHPSRFPVGETNVIDEASVSIEESKEEVVRHKTKAMIIEEFVLQFLELADQPLVRRLVVKNALHTNFPNYPQTSIGTMLHTAITALVAKKKALIVQENSHKSFYATTSRVSDSEQARVLLARMIESNVSESIPSSEEEISSCEAVLVTTSGAKTEIDHPLSSSNSKSNSADLEILSELQGLCLCVGIVADRISKNFQVKDVRVMSILCEAIERIHSIE